MVRVPDDVVVVLPADHHNLVLVDLDHDHGGQRSREGDGTGNPRAVGLPYQS